MINMMAKDFEQVFMLDRRINSKQEQLEQLNDSLLKITANVSGDVVKGGKSVDFTDTVNKIVDLRADITADIDKLIDLKNKIRLVINKLEPLESAVMELRYINLLKWKQIYPKIGYCGRHIRRLHAEALIKIKMS